MQFEIYSLTVMSESSTIKYSHCTLQRRTRVEINVYKQVTLSNSKISRDLNKF